MSHFKWPTGRNVKLEIFEQDQDWDSFYLFVSWQVGTDGSKSHFIIHLTNSTSFFEDQTDSNVFIYIYL